VVSLLPDAGTEFDDEQIQQLITYNMESRNKLLKYLDHEQYNLYNRLTNLSIGDIRKKME
jgi:hypothetical protein